MHIPDHERRTSLHAASSPTPLSTPAASAGTSWRADLARALTLAVGVRLGLVLVAVVTGRALFEFTEPLLPLLARAVQQWDAAHYLRIADVGYHAVGEDRFRLNFLPLYPLLISVLSPVTFGRLGASLLISLVSSVAAGVLLQRLVRLDGSDDEARRALWYCFLFPTAYFLAVPYSEALFLALALAAVLAARQRRWALAGLAGMLAAATRLQGLCLISALLVEALQQGRVSFLRRLPWVLLVPFGFLAYLAVNWLVAGDPLAFLETRRTALLETLVPPWQPIQEAARYLFANPPSYLRTFIYGARLVAAVVGAGILLIGARWLRPSYQVYGWSALLLPLFSGRQIGLPRFLLVIFPLFLVLARLGRRERVHELLLPLFALLQAGLFTLYAAGRWAF